jgi:hypothetical protein
MKARSLIWMVGASIIVISAMAGCVTNSPPGTAPVAAPAPTLVPFKPVSRVGDEVRIDAGCMIDDYNHPSRLLSTELKRDQKARRFRVSWKVVMGGFSGAFTVLYDRQRKTVEYWSHGGHAEVGPMRDHYLFGRVTDSVIHRLSRSRIGGSDDAGFFTLPVYGCTRQKLP